MKNIQLIFVSTLLALSSLTSFSQIITQDIRGRIIDAASESPVAFATVVVSTCDPQRGTTSDEQGYFRIGDIPVGRHNLQVSSVNYESRVIPEILVTSGKELVINVGLKEKINVMEEVVIKAAIKKDKPINSMASVSARTFSVEEAQRYAGGFDDPARLASSFAGVATGYLDDNSIIIRGNAPKGLLWRLEGIEISNPNHFANMTTFGGGGVSALSSLMLANSDFFTGAFPAEYGNAMSGVFDIRLRKGNNEKYEHAFQLGALGVDLSSEGPLSKNKRASYLFNYRYSTFGLIQPILPEGANLPIYQDLSFKINLPTEKAGNFSIWALGAANRIDFEPETDTTLWSYEEDVKQGGAKQRMAVLALSHRIPLGNKSYLNSTYALSGDKTEYELGVIDRELNYYDTEYIDNRNFRHTFSSTLNHKFGARHSFRGGLIFNRHQYNTLLKFATRPGETLLTTVDEESTLLQAQVFGQSRISLARRWNINLGLHGQYLDLNQEFVLEPRLGLTWQFRDNQGLSLAYGKHSRLEPLGIYFALVEGNEGISQPNRSLPISKSHHLVLAYDVSIRPQLRLKVEPFVQYLYDIPVIGDSSYSTINLEGDWFFNSELESSGTGLNYGIDLTLERFLKNGFYYLATASVFESTYRGGDGVERNTRYNTGYVVNLLFGKEWVLGWKKNKILGINGRLNLLGGQRMTPVDYGQSEKYGQVIYDYKRAWEGQKPMVYHVNASINYRINKKKHASTWSLQVMNLLGSEEFYGYQYNYREDRVDESKVSVIVPSISYRIEF